MKEMISVISMQSRGELVNVAIDGAAAPFWKAGKAILHPDRAVGDVLRKLPRG
jgi:sulfur-oxidizing protein SoxA